MTLLEVTRNISDNTDNMFDVISEIKDANEKAKTLIQILAHHLFGVDDDCSAERALAFQINCNDNKVLLNTISDYLFNVEELLNREVDA